MPRIYKDGVLYNTSPSTASQLPYDNNTSTKDKIDSKMDKANPTGTGSLSLNKASGSSLGTNAVALGYNCTASGTNSHAEGYQTTASAPESHAENESTTASGSGSHAEGKSTTASGKYAHAEGIQTTARGKYAHAENNTTMASGDESHAEGYNTIANHTCQHVFGQYNIEDPSSASAGSRGNYIEIVGKGTSDEARSNARTLDWSGNEVLAGDCTIMGDKSLNNAITPYYYNANTDRNTQSNRETAIKYVLTNYFSKGGNSATIRYYGGYYNSYIYCGGSSSNLQIIEFCQMQSSGEKVIYWMYTTSNNELNKIFALS